MAELRMFPNGRETDEARMARLEAHIFHLWQRQRDAEIENRRLANEQKELKKDREALIKYIGWRIVLFLGLVIGGLVSKGSTHGSLMTAIYGALTSSFGQ